MTNDEKYQLELIARSGLKHEELTQEQIDIILEPIDAPENYACDGEISPRQAKTRWKTNMSKAGLTPLQIFKAEKFIFG